MGCADAFPRPKGGLENQEMNSTTSTKPMMTVKIPPATMRGIILLVGLMLVGVSHG